MNSRILQKQNYILLETLKDKNFSGQGMVPRNISAQGIQVCCM